MTGAGPELVIEGTRGDWPNGARTLSPRDPCREPIRADLVVRRRVRPGRQPGVVPDRLGGRPPDEGADARGPAATAWSTLSSPG